METTHLPPDKHCFFFWFFYTFSFSWHCLRLRGFLCPELILVSTCSPVVLITSSSTLARCQMSQPQSWRLFQGYCNKKSCRNFRSGQELTLVSVSQSLLPVKSVFVERIILFSISHITPNCTAASYQIKKPLACQCTLKCDFNDGCQMMLYHFLIADTVKHYEKVTTFSLISCHGLSVIKTFQSNSRLPFLGIMWYNR